LENKREARLELRAIFQAASIAELDQFSTEETRLFELAPPVVQ
jgi:uncharacterized coiled-coil protein SlyX